MWTESVHRENIIRAYRFCGTRFNVAHKSRAIQIQLEPFRLLGQRGRTLWKAKIAPPDRSIGDLKANAHFKPIMSSCFAIKPGTGRKGQQKKRPEKGRKKVENFKDIEV